MDNPDVKINVASFEDGDALQRAFFDAMRRSGAKFSDLTAEDNLDKIISAVLFANADMALNAALWPCLARCTYKGQKITKATFEDVETRQHYFPIVAKCIEVNINPFISGLRLLWSLFRSPESQSDTP